VLPAACEDADAVWLLHIHLLVNIAACVV